MDKAQVINPISQRTRRLVSGSRISCRMPALIAALWLGACSSHDATGGIVPEGDPELPMDRGVVVFEDENDDGLNVSVREFADGSLGLAVTAPMGTDLPLAESLAGIYQTMNSREIIPSAVQALSDRIEELIASARVAMPVALDESPPEEAIRIEKSQQAFFSFCNRAYFSGGFRYDPMQCEWADDSFGVSTRQGLNPGDRSYVWNMRPQSAGVSWENPNTFQVVLGQVPANGTGFFTHPGAQAPPYRATISTGFYPGVIAGELGISDHQAASIIR